MHPDDYTKNDYKKNVLDHIHRLVEDEAGPDPEQIAQRFGIPVTSLAILSRNENSYGPSPHATAALGQARLNRYPDLRPFISALSSYTGYPDQSLVAGAGMDEIITTIFRIFLGPGDRVLIPVPTYNLYGLATELCAARPIYQERLMGWDVDPRIPECVKMVFLCSPNNPTGNALTESRVREILEETRAIVFLDEAYVEFAKKSLIDLVREHDNLVVGRTLSKAFGLAGLRLGYAVAPEWVAREYRRVAPLFSISSPSLAAGVAALQDLDWMSGRVRNIVQERDRMAESLHLDRSSQGNFLYIQTEEKARTVVDRLLRKGIIVRDCSSFPGCGNNCLRVTVGRPEENDRFLEEFNRIKGAGSGR